MNNIIYYIKGKSTFCYKLNIDGVKIGSTQNIISRIKTYHILVGLILVYSFF